MDGQFGNWVLILIGSISIIIFLSKWGALTILESIDEAIVRWHEGASRRNRAKYEAMMSHDKVQKILDGDDKSTIQRIMEQ